MTYFSVKKHIFFPILFVTMSINSFAQFSGGNGTEETPYLITIPLQLRQLAIYVNNADSGFNSAHYRLGNDVDLSDYSVAWFNNGEGWIPIGRGSRPFMGVFDGNNRTITGLFINTTSSIEAGLFGRVHNGSIKNLRIQNVNITTSGDAGGIVGRLVGTSSVSNSSSTGSVAGSSAGGVVGYINTHGQIFGCFSECTVSSSVSMLTSGNNYAGGLVGYMGPFGMVSNSYSTGSVTSSLSAFSGASAAGGVVGHNNGGSVLHSYSTGNISSTILAASPTQSAISSAGGIVGHNEGNGIVSSNYSTGSISSSATSPSWTQSHSCAGGIVGLNDWGRVSNNAALNSNISCVSTNVYFGRIIGFSDIGTILGSNIAFDNMLNPENIAIWDNRGMLNSDGEDIDNISINADGTLGGRFSTTEWTNVSGRLPGLLGHSVPMPFHLRVPPTITTDSLPAGTIHSVYNQILASIGETPISWSLVDGDLPIGLDLSAAGRLSGTPREAGVFDVVVRATNAVGYDIKELSIIILPPVPLIQDVWEDGVLSSGDGAVRFSFDVIEDTAYYIWWSDNYQGDGTKTAEIVVRSTYSDCFDTYIFGSATSNITVDSAWNTPQQFIADQTGTVYIEVRPYDLSPSNVGTFAIVYSVDSIRPCTGDYIVTYDINDGTGTTLTEQEVCGGVGIVLISGDGFTKEGYTFGGWNTNSYGTGTNFNAGASFRPINSITLYARWHANARTPNITAHPQDTVYNHETEAVALTVTATVDDEGTLSYQWFRNAANSTTNSIVIAGETGASYTPPTTTVGTMHYYVVITNTNDSTGGVRIAIATSDIATITVVPIVNVETPTITAVLQNATYDSNAPEPTTFTVTATGVSDSCTLSYQWFTNAENNTSTGTPITDSIGTSFTPSTELVGTRYYYVVVTNTNEHKRTKTDFGSKSYRKNRCKSYC